MSRLKARMDKLEGRNCKGEEAIIAFMRFVSCGGASRIGQACVSVVGDFHPEDDETEDAFVERVVLASETSVKSDHAFIRPSTSGKWQP